MRESIDGAVFLGGISVANGDDEQKDDFLLRGFVERSEDFLYQSVEEPVNVTVLMSCARTTNTEVGGVSLVWHSKNFQNSAEKLLDTLMMR